LGGGGCDSDLPKGREKRIYYKHPPQNWRKISREDVKGKGL